MFFFFLKYMNTHKQRHRQTEWEMKTVLTGTVVLQAGKRQQGVVVRQRSGVQHMEPRDK